MGDDDSIISNMQKTWPDVAVSEQVKGFGLNYRYGPTHTTPLDAFVQKVMSLRHDDGVVHFVAYTVFMLDSKVQITCSRPRLTIAIAIQEVHYTENLIVAR